VACVLSRGWGGGGGGCEQHGARVDVQRAEALHGHGRAAVGGVHAEAQAQHREVPRSPASLSMASLADADGVVHVSACLLYYPSRKTGPEILYATATY
jgi:hypothetical protein